GGALFMYRLDKGGLNIDFTGGTAYTGQLTEKHNIKWLRTQLEGVDLPDVSIEQIFVSNADQSQGDESVFFTVRTAEKNAADVQREGQFSRLELKVPTGAPRSPDTLQKALTAMRDQFQAQPQPERLENFDAALAAKTQTTAMYAILASWAAILLYLWFRFGN